MAKTRTKTKKGKAKAAKKVARRVTPKVKARSAKGAAKGAAKRATTRSTTRSKKRVTAAKPARQTVRKPVKRKRAARPSAAPKRATPPAAKKAARKTSAVRRAPSLDRDRRTVREEQVVPGPPSSLDLNRHGSAARTGRREMNERLREHTSTGPVMTGGDVDANWEDAESVGDEAPGGDSPTPDQDIVEEIGQAFGVTYQDNQELQGGRELEERDRKRWELDPASREPEE